MLKAVLFDLDNTLYDNSKQVHSAREKAVIAMISAGLGGRKKDVMKVLEAVVSKKGSNYPHHYDELVKSISAGENPAIVAAGVMAYHKTKQKYLRPYPEVVKTLRMIKGMGLRLGVVTDGVPVKQWEKLIRLGFADVFDAVIVSPDEREHKPSPKPFLKAAKKLGIPPKDCLVVGDRADRDILGGNRAGMATALVVRKGQEAPKSFGKGQEPDYILQSLSDVVKIIR